MALIILIPVAIAIGGAVQAFRADNSYWLLLPAGVLVLGFAG